ncbi:uncharacterized protein PFL1_02471 [Pseudozyma flocculosa PF-1]|uniref:Uncharacterized protein n=2 Tax=Pseudozyma flocculosa TaxID=84751 RepID=A0A5C3EXY3_9BASI|nr:uncharacterized protein PFL1_02471 [Pseudozyma flocculosa PF-1]EPQ29798.1 hypothetical protein PFL1_02471 [Pseudozyma flocculosa PF-1]SPO37088.1 uncharacterized protein PSFLO_02560 [Pseudozyma flocculosa]
MTAHRGGGGGDMDGETLRGDSDAFSMLTTTTARLEMPILAHESYEAPQAVTEPFPPFLLHCTLFAFYEGYPPHPAAFCNIGLPARYARGESSASHNRVAQKVSRYNRRLGVQLPLHYLDTDPTSADVKALFFHPHPKDGAALMARQPSLKRGRMFTMFAAMSPELTGMVSRPLVDRVLSALFFGSGIKDQMAIFPGEAVLTYGARYRKEGKARSQDKGEGGGGSGSGSGGALGWLKAWKPSSAGDGSRDADMSKGKAKSVEAESPAGTTPGHVKLGMVYATLDLLPPPGRLLETRGPYPKEMNRVSSAEQDRAVQIQVEASRLSPEERYRQFGWELDEAGRADMMRMLKALERRGGIWSEAGRVTMPSSRNPDPRERPRYLVKGLFPEHFTQRCAWFRHRDHQPQTNDLSPESIAKFGCPVVVHTADERLGAGADIAQRTSSNPATASEKELSMDAEWHEDDLPKEDTAAAATASDVGNMNGYGTDSARAQALIDAEGDFFEGWSIGVTAEPFKTGGFYESMASSTGLAVAVGANG